ncbi:MAG: hypothetical protein WC500_04525 [Candidatus Margulisiibacteriota bacterium]
MNSRIGDASNRGMGSGYRSFRGHPLRSHEVVNCETPKQLERLMADVDRVRGAIKLGRAFPLSALGRSQHFTVGSQGHEIVVVTTPKINRLVVGGLINLISGRINEAKKYRRHDYLQVNANDANKIAAYLSKFNIGVTLPEATNDPLHRVIRNMIYSADFWTDSAGTLTQYSMLLTGGQGRTFFTKGGVKDLDEDLTNEMRKALLVLVRQS